MFGLEKIADWWDGEFEASENILQEWVNGGKSDTDVTLRAAGATVVHTAMALGGGMVDVLRIGEGVKEGGWSYAKDGLRLLSLAGPLVKLGRLGAARWRVDLLPTKGVCTTVALTGALRRTGTRIFVTVHDLLAARGKGATGAFIDEYIPILRSMGAKMQEVTKWTIQSLPELTAANPKSVVVFSIRWGGKDGHTVYAFRNTFGQFKIADRSGLIVDSIEEISKFYQQTAPAVPWPNTAALIIKNSIIVEGASNLSMLALEMDVLLNRSGGDREVVFSPVE